MAKIVESFPKPLRGPHFGGDPQWFNGQIWELDRWTDLESYKSISSARGSMVQYARGLRLKLHTAIAGDTLTIQAYADVSREANNASV